MPERTECPWCGSTAPPLPTDLASAARSVVADERWLRANPLMCPSCFLFGERAYWGEED